METSSRDRLEALRKRARLAELREKAKTQQAPEQVAEPSFLDSAQEVLGKATAVPRAALDIGQTLASGIIAEPLSGLAGIAAQVSDGGFNGGEMVESVQEAMTRAPQTELGGQALQAAGEALQPVTDLAAKGTEFLSEGAASLAESAGLGVEGQGIAAAAGAAIPTAIGSFFGGAPAAKALAKIPTAKQDLKSKLESEGIDATDDNLAGFRVGDDGRVKSDPLGKRTINQGFEPGVISAVKASSPADKKAMLKMLDTLDKGKKNRLFSVDNRPSDVIGDTMKDRIIHIRNVNKAAGKRLDAEAAKLKGQSVEFEPAVENFRDELEGMGIRFRPEDNSPIYKGSDIEGLDGVQSVLNNVLNRMKNTRTPDAFDVHRMKRFIDEQVTYGKTQGGFGGQADRIIKQLRSELDGALDTKFPEYNRVNTEYSDTIGALDTFQEVAGRKMNLEGKRADKAIGTLMRRVMSNAQSRVPLLDAIDEVSEISAKYGGNTDIELKNLNLVANEFERRFGSQARTSFNGGIEDATARTARDTERLRNSSATGLALEGGAKLFSLAKGQTDDRAIGALRALLQRELKQAPKTPQPNQSTLPAVLP